MHVWRALACSLLALLAAPGCAPVLRSGQSPLTAAKMSPDSVVLEIFSIRFPFGEPHINGPLWAEVDEQAFDPALRQRLAENGLRAGVVEGAMPDALQQLLGMSSQPAAAAEPSVVSLEEESAVTLRQLQSRAGRRSEIVASKIHEELPLLVFESGELGGQNYPKGQAIFAIKSFPQGDGRVRLALVPELHHGEPRQTWVGSQGVLRLEAGRARRVFDELALEATLAPGQVLVLTSLPDRARSLGYYFFSDRSSGTLEQKLLLVRLAQTQYSDLFAPELVLPPEE